MRRGLERSRQHETRQRQQTLGESRRPACGPRSNLVRIERQCSLSLWLESEPLAILPWIEALGSQYSFRQDGNTIALLPAREVIRRCSGVARIQRWESVRLGGRRKSRREQQQKRRENFSSHAFSILLTFINYTTKKTRGGTVQLAGYVEKTSKREGIEEHN